MPLRSHKLYAVKANLVEVSLSIVYVFRDSPEQAAGVPSRMLSKKPHLVQPSVRFRGALMYFPRAATADR